MTYQILLESKAVKSFKSFDRKTRQQIREALETLVVSPTKGSGVKRLSKPLSGYRLRSGDYRILYTVQKQRVTIYSIAHRKDVYR